MGPLRVRRPANARPPGCGTQAPAARRVPHLLSHRQQRRDKVAAAPCPRGPCCHPSGPAPDMPVRGLRELAAGVAPACAPAMATRTAPPYSRSPARVNQSASHSLRATAVEVRALAEGTRSIQVTGECRGVW